MEHPENTSKTLARQRLSRDPEALAMLGIDVPDCAWKFTMFKDTLGSSMVWHGDDYLFPEIEELFWKTKARSKEKLPLIKLAEFGIDRTDKGSFRHTDNIRQVTGVEVDYDGGRISPEEARDALEGADLAGFVYTTPSHTADAPRWRILCPMDGRTNAKGRAKLVARLNGLFDGALAAESFTASQSFYFGHVGSPDAAAYLVPGRYIDVATELDAGAIGRRGDAEEGTGEADASKVDMPLDLIADALFTIPNTRDNPDAEERDWWLNIVAAIHHQTDGSEEGLAIAEEWSARHHSHKRRNLLAAWRSFGRYRHDPITARLILAEARKHGWRDVAELHRLFEELDADPDYGEEDEGGRVRKSRLTFLSPGDCASRTARRYVVKGLIAEGDVAAVVGAPGVGKSLLAPRLGYAVAQGEPIFGLRTRQGGVLYVAAEDESGMRSRVTALYRDHGAADDFTLVGGVSSLFPDSPDLRDLKRAVKERRPSLVVIDTLAIAFPGLEENSAEGMGRVVAAARSLTKWGAAVILVHHDTKDGSNGLPRGHSLLNGALDMSLHLTRDDDLVVAKPTKNRNGSSDVRFGFGIGTRVLGVDEDGDEITTAICEERGEMPPERREDRLPPAAKAALRILTGLAEGRTGVLEDEWREACCASDSVSASDDPETRKRAFRRAKAELVRKAKVEMRGDKFAPTGSISPDDFEGDDDDDFI